MSTSSIMMFFFLVTTVVFLIAAGGVGGHMYDQLSWEAAARSGCSGTIAECINNNNNGAGAAGELEMEFDQVISRRILATTNYISYGALQRNTVPCSQRGASYYNCKAGAEANPYTRGCSAITRCRS